MFIFITLGDGDREGNGTLLQYSCLENPMDGGAWEAAVHGVAKSQTWLSNFTFTFHFYALEKEMATHSSDLAWRIPGTGEPGGLLSLGSHRVRYDWSDLTAAGDWDKLQQDFFWPKYVLLVFCSKDFVVFNFIIIGKDICIPMFIATTLTITRTWKPPKYPSKEEWIKKRWHLNTMEY